MSNHNPFWGKRFGYLHKDGTLALVKRQMSTGRSNSGTSQNTIQTPQSKRDVERHKELGRPSMFVRGTRRSTPVYA